MFTGIIEELGKVRNIKRNKTSMTLEISCLKVLEGSIVGDSIATNGVCLTITKKSKDYYCADIMHETYNTTTLKYLRINSEVNLERALTLNKRLGGHIVTGHVDTTAKIIKKSKFENAVIYELIIKPIYLNQISIKDSIAIDGVSLTVQDITNRTLKVSVIPHTLNQTILVNKNINDLVNIEIDTLKKQSPKKSNITKDFLKENGFL